MPLEANLNGQQLQQLKGLLIRTHQFNLADKLQRVKAAFRLSRVTGIGYEIGLVDKSNLINLFRDA
jgi:hypothetical protein